MRGGEDERAAALWNAPFILLVHDDSPDARLEYVNQAACQLFGRDYLDLFGSRSHELVAGSATAQSEWAFALRDAEESPARFATLPALELAVPGGRRVMATNVVVWRVDSLEDTPVGQAVLIRDWQVA